MSEEVKRFVVDIQGREARECVFAADHDRIVAGLTEAGVRMQAERDKWQQEAIRIAVAVCALGKMEFDQLTDDSKLIEVMSIIREAIQERDTLRAEVERLRELLRLAGIVAQTARVIVGGADFTTGAQIRPCGIYDIASAAERLRDALDEYDRAVIESSMDRSVK